MKTNREKYDFYLNKIRQLTQEFIAKECQSTPKIFYTISGWTVHEMKVTKFDYYNKFYSEDKPTKIRIAEIKEYYEAMPPFSREKILLCYEYPLASMTASGAYKLVDIESGK